MTDEILLETEDKMQKAIEVMENRFLNVRAGRANPRILDKVMPEYYGTPTPLIQLVINCDKIREKVKFRALFIWKAEL